MKIRIYLSVLLVVAIFFSCEKEDAVTPQNLAKEDAFASAIDPSTPISAYYKTVVPSDVPGLKAANVGKYKLVFSDEFDGGTLDETKWSKNYPNCCGFGKGGHTHNHNAWMAEENVSVSGGNLVITAKAERHPDAPESVNQGGKKRVLKYQAGAVHTKGKFEFTYGYMEARVKSTRARGSWPAFWTLNKSGGWPPEIDILEIPVKDKNAHKVHHFYYHYGPNWKEEKSFGSSKNENKNLSAAFHKYACDWGPNYMKFYFDGKLVGSYSGRDECKQGYKMFLLLNLAVGGWGGSVTDPSAYPDDYVIDWVRVYQKRYFVIKNRKTGKCLRVRDGATLDNTQIVTYDQQNDWESEHFCFPYIGGKRLIFSRAADMVLRPEDGGSANNTNVVINKNENWAAQKWVLVDAGNGYYNIKNSKTGKYLQPYNGESANNTNVVIHEANNDKLTQWELIPVN